MKPIATALLLLTAACGLGKPPLTDQFPGDWQQENADDIRDALTRNGVTECRELKYKQRAGGKREYRVRCSPNGSIWQTYSVWPGTGDVSGPYPINPALD